MNDPNLKKYELVDKDPPDRDEPVVMGTIETYQEIFEADLTRAVDEIKDGLISPEQVAGQFYGKFLPVQ